MHYRKKMPRKKKSQLRVQKGKKGCNNNQSEENDDGATATQSTLSDTATTQGTTVSINDTHKLRPTLTRKHRKLPSPGSVRRSKRIRSRSSSVGEETDAAVATTSKGPRMEIKDEVPAAVPGPSRITDTANAGTAEAYVNEEIPAISPGKIWFKIYIFLINMRAKL